MFWQTDEIHVQKKLTNIWASTEKGEYRSRSRSIDPGVKKHCWNFYPLKLKRKVGMTRNAFPSQVCDSYFNLAFIAQVTRMTAGAVAVPTIMPLRAPVPGVHKSTIDTNTKIELRSGLFEFYSTNWECCSHSSIRPSVCLSTVPPPHWLPPISLWKWSGQDDHSAVVVVIIVVVVIVSHNPSPSNSKSMDGRAASTLISAFVGQMSGWQLTLMKLQLSSWLEWKTVFVFQKPMEPPFTTPSMETNQNRFSTSVLLRSRRWSIESRSDCRQANAPWRQLLSECQYSKEENQIAEKPEKNSPKISVAWKWHSRHVSWQEKTPPPKYHCFLAGTEFGRVTLYRRLLTWTRWSLTTWMQKKTAWVSWATYPRLL